MEHPNRRNTVDAMSWWEYVVRVAQAERQREITERTGIDETNVSRWKRGAQKPKADMVAQFARAYGRPVLEAFIAAGFLTPEEAEEQPMAAPSLEAVPDEDLTDELLRRLRDSSSVPRPKAVAAKGVKRQAPTPTRGRRSPGG